jgi:hypothetical protein
VSFGICKNKAIEIESGVNKRVRKIYKKKMKTDQAKEKKKKGPF